MLNVNVKFVIMWFLNFGLLFNVIYVFLMLLMIIIIDRCGNESSEFKINIRFGLLVKYYLL